MARRADAFLRAQRWCGSVADLRLGAGVGGVVAAFLARVEPARGHRVDEWLWVVVGDLPTVYLVLDESPTPAEALQTYCELMEDWVRAVRTGAPLDDVYPVAAPATPENAAALARRIEHLRAVLVPELARSFEQRVEDARRR
ncbi:MAG: hypothetical protein M9894_07160 [Planctomycetes bacterium]|nr:hypothetical protein [Planctomycetota bacterium]